MFEDVNFLKLFLRISLFDGGGRNISYVLYYSIFHAITLAHIAVNRKIFKKLNDA